MASTGRAAKTESKPSPDGEAIRRRAHELWLDRGDKPGSALDDWVRAEEELGSELEAEESEE